MSVRYLDEDDCTAILFEQHVVMEINRDPKDKEPFYLPDHFYSRRQAASIAFGLVDALTDQATDAETEAAVELVKRWLENYANHGDMPF
jgi:hypothetical protein